MRFVDLFAGLGGFHLALRDLGHECVFASELDIELRAVYEKNFKEMKGKVFGDIRECKKKIPAHDILCAGFPCQPFSKSGAQKGMKDKTRGTLFHEILEVLQARSPKYVILENVGNFEMHDNGRTWQIVRDSLEGLGYFVKGTEHVTNGGHGLVSPHHLGFPHTRERFFIVASRSPLPSDPFPKRDRERRTSLSSLVLTKAELSVLDKEETTISDHYVECINHWNKFLQRIPSSTELPSFPIWGDEIGASYPFEDRTPFACSGKELRAFLNVNGSPYYDKKDLLDLLPSYARSEVLKFPNWKARFIRQNRAWFKDVSRYLSAKWIQDLRQFPPSLRKLEWNCKEEERNLWKCVLQFRPSGLRAKRYTSSPALVAMTTSQVPILGPKRRFITRIEGLRLLGFFDNHQLPNVRDKAFQALGNAVHVEVVKAIVRGMLENPNTQPH